MCKNMFNTKNTTVNYLPKSLGWWSGLYRKRCCDGKGGGEVFHWNSRPCFSKIFND